MLVGKDAGHSQAFASAFFSSISLSLLSYSYCLFPCLAHLPISSYNSGRVLCASALLLSPPRIFHSLSVTALSLDHTRGNE